MILRRESSWERKSRTNRCPSLCSMALLAFVAAATHLAVPAGFAQTASTGAITGTVMDPSDKLVPGAVLKLINEETGENRSSESKRDGSFEFFLLLPGSYRLEVSKAGFKVASYRHVRVAVTETTALDIHLEIGSTTESVTVQASPVQLETESSALGRVTDEQTVDNLPLVTRNYTQIIGLSPGVSNEVNNATTLGPGGGGLSAGTTGFSAHGAATNDNNYQMNGAQVNDLMASGNLSSGVPIPNPDTIQEFKVQTSQYDASYGRNSGANVDVVTKAGSNDFHGTVFEFLRNDVLNANDFFLKETGTPKPPLKQNQFGFTLGGPIKRDKLQFFTSYQGTRQRDGYDAMAACLQTILSPPLTNDRSRRGLGAVFGGQPGALGGTVAPDGSNIDQVALNIMEAKLPNGQFLIPTPQAINPSAPFGVQGITSLAQSCAYNEDQFITNADFHLTSRSSFTGRFFFSDGNQAVTFPPSQLLAVPSFPGFPRGLDSAFRNASITWTYIFNSNLLNNAVFGYSRTKSQLSQGYPTVTFPAATSPVTFNFANIGVTAPDFSNSFPAIAIVGAGSIGGNGQGITLTQNLYDFEDNLTWVHGHHSIHFGGGITRTQLDNEGFHFIGGLAFVNYADFLLGQVFESVDVPGLFDRAWRTWDGNLFVQDDFRVLPRLTLNLGFRWDRLGALGDELGRSAIFDPALADPNPPAAGSLDGFVVASNFSGGPIPAGVVQSGNNAATRELGQNGWEPRIGFSWQLPWTNNRFVLRGGYGIYRSRTTGQPIFQLLTDQPFGEERIQEVGATTGAPIPFENPFFGNPTLPAFAPYSPTTAQSIFTLSPRFQPPIVQQYSMNLQTQLARNFLLEVGYVGARGTKLELDRAFNQALLATPADPIRRQTDNTFSNVQLRVPIDGFLAQQAVDVESDGASWYNALTASLTKRFSNGLQFLASYTWASSLTDSPSFAADPNGGIVTGDQNNVRAGYGPDSFLRPQRFVFSYYYQFPGPRDLNSLEGRFLGGWGLSGVTTIQSGQRLTITDLNEVSVFGVVATDRAQLAPGCTPSQLETHGSVTGRINEFFNASCFALPPIIGADGLGTGFGNSGTGIVSGPDQRNFDIAILKRTPIRERMNLEFRAEFFNAFNVPQFSNPDTNLGTVTIAQTPTMPPALVTALAPNATFGHITMLSVNPRIIQLALKLNF